MNKLTEIPLMFFLLSFAILISLSCVSAASTVYVNATGSDSNLGTIDSPFQTINKGMSSVDDNGTVKIANGNYTGVGNVNLTISKNMTIAGQSQKGTIINGTGTNWVFHISSGFNVTLQNLTITNATAIVGGAIWNDGTLNVTGCTFTGNTATGYGGVYGGAYGGGAIFNTGTITDMSGCTFTGNNVAFIGGALLNYGGTINNISSCTFTGNKALAGGAIYNYGGTINNISGCIFTGNTAVNAGGAIAIYEGTIINVINCIFAGNIGSTSQTGLGGGVIAIWGSGNLNTVHYSSFVNNTALNANAIYSDNLIDARYNWWGSNAGPKTIANLFKGNINNINCNPWLCMAIIVNPTSIAYGGHGIATVSFNNAYDGTTVTSLNPADGHIPDGTIVGFNSLLGTFNPATITTINGIATTIFTATSLGTGNINATTDSETLLADITVTQAATMSTVSNVTSVNGKTVNLTAILKDENGNLLTGKTVTFTVNGVSYTAVTDDNGIAKVNYKLTKAGVYTVTVNFVDGIVYANSTGNGTLTVNPTANLYINTTSSNLNPKTGDTFVLTYKLGNYGPDAASNVTITFQLPEGLTFEDITVDTGRYTYDPTTRTVTWTLDSVPVGDPYLYLTVKAVGDGTYKITPSITSDTYNLNSGDSGIITINVQSNNNNSSNETTVKAVDNTIIGLQKTGLPLNYLILAVLMVLSGLVTKRK